MPSPSLAFLTPARAMGALALLGLLGAVPTLGLRALDNHIDAEVSRRLAAATPAVSPSVAPSNREHAEAARRSAMELQRGLDGLSCLMELSRQQKACKAAIRQVALNPSAVILEDF